MDNDLLIAAIDAAEQSSYSSDGDTQLSSDRAYAIDLYNGKNLEPAPDGRSQVIDRSVFETVQWILPSLCRIFANGDDVVELPPVGPEDEEGAKQESQYLNHVILQKNNWFETFITWATDAMLTKNGYCMAYSEERQNVELEQYKRQTEQGVALLMSDKDVNVSVDQQYPDPDHVEPPPQPAIDPMTGQPQIDPMTGQPAMMPPQPAPMLFDVTVTRTQPERKVCVRVLPPERCKISYRTPTFRINRECPYFEYYDYKTLSDLRADGFDVPETIPDDWQIDEEEDLARDQYDEQSWRNDSKEPDESMRRHRVRMIWLKHDANQDGIAEMMYVVRIGRHVLHAEQVSRIPVASIAAIPNAHRHIATSIADIVSDIQRIKTAILRQGLDNLYLANNPRTFITDKVNLDDALVSRPGGIVRGESGAVYGQDIAPLVMPFVFPQAMEGLEYMDQVRENRTGTNRYFTGIDQNAMNKTATGIQQLSSMAAQRVEQIARIMACGVEDLFSIVHELILKGGHKSEVVKLSNKWVQVDPASWKKRTDFRISVGYAAGNKDSQVQKLMFLANMQGEAMMKGLPIVTPDNMYETAIELTKASDFSAPQRFWTNPKDVPPPGPPQPDPTVMAAEQLKSQTTLQKTQVEAQIKDKELQLKKYEIDTKAQVELVKTDAQFEHAEKIEGARQHHEGNLEQFRASKSSEADDKKLFADAEMKKIKERQDTEKKQLTDKASRADAVEKQFTELAQAFQTMQNAPRRVKRGKDGKAEAIEIIGEDGAVLVSKKVVRGKDGRIEGVA
jgi:hypothetical protein